MHGNGTIALLHLHNYIFTLFGALCSECAPYFPRTNHWNKPSYHRVPVMLLHTRHLFQNQITTILLPRHTQRFIRSSPVSHSPNSPSTHPSHHTTHQCSRTQDPGTSQGTQARKARQQSRSGLPNEAKHREAQRARTAFDLYMSDQPVRLSAQMDACGRIG